MNTIRYKNDVIEEALRACDGKVSLAAERLGCAQSTIYSRIENSPKLREVVEESRTALVDLAETKLREAVEAGQIAAICFVLKCQGKSRGWIERQEVVSETRTRVEITGRARILEDQDWYSDPARITVVED